MRLFLSAHLGWLTATQSTTERKQPEGRFPGGWPSSRDTRRPARRPKPSRRPSRTPALRRVRISQPWRRRQVVTVQADHSVVDAVPGGQQQHRRPPPAGPQAPGDLQPVHAWQHHVQHDGAVVGLGGQPQRLGTANRASSSTTSSRMRRVCRPRCEHHVSPADHDDGLAIAATTPPASTRSPPTSAHQHPTTPLVAIYRMAASLPTYFRPEIVRGQQCPLAHADDPVARPGQDGATAAVVEHLNVDPAVVSVEPHLGPGAEAGMLVLRSLSAV
jgi:hypothetical protein